VNARDAGKQDEQVNSMNDDPIQREQLSALVDGEASELQLQAVLAYAESDEGQQSWRMYHLIGDVLRSPELAHHSQHDVLSGVRAFMASEPLRQAESALPLGQLEQVVPVPQSQSSGRLVGNGAPVVAFPTRSAANASVFRWKMAAGVASMAAVAAIGWSVMLSGTSQQSAVLAADLGAPQASALMAAAPASVSAEESGPPLGEQAQSSSVVAVAGPYGQSVMLRDPRLDELLASHPQYSSAANLQMPASFLRNANFASMRPAPRR
jgi:sigma-E factor negative regulatory protein RseA